jgi:tetratricopeptide (TPR) repeat protein
VEQALLLLPDLEALAPLRTLLLSTARSDERQIWASAGPYLTVGKRAVDPGELRRRMPQLLSRISEQVSFLYEAYAEALESHARGDTGGTVSALIAAGEREEHVGRLAPARAWYEAARPFAGLLHSRGAETDCLRRLAGVSLVLGRYDESARYYQRCLALAEAEDEPRTAIVASAGLGDVALARGEWSGARAWYQRGMRLAEAAGDVISTGRLERQLGLLAYRLNDMDGAEEHLRRARESFEKLGEANELARVLETQGRVAALRGRPQDATAAFREALAWSHQASGEPDLEILIRLDLGELALESGKLLEAEEELRRAEEFAITRNLPHRLIRVYALMGRLRGIQNDETGFVFFEQAIELCRTLGRSPNDEARVSEEYGWFRARIGHGDEARAYLERARDLFHSIGKSTEVARITDELARLTV